MTIWELLDEATRSLPQSFTRADILRWFAAHHPEIHPPSISAHLQSATSNAPEESKHAGLRSSPVTWCTTGDPSSLVSQAVMAWRAGSFTSLSVVVSTACDRARTSSPR